MRSRVFRSWWVLGMVAAACTDPRVKLGDEALTGGGGGSVAPERVCEPGSIQVCVGPAGCRGGQVCNLDGSAWGACDCGGGIAGSPASGGAPAVGGTFGTGGLPATGGSGGTVMPPYGLVPLDPANDITLQACACSLWEPPAIPVALELAVDVSTSMNNQPPNSTSGQTKWELTRNALIAALDHLPAAAQVGVSFFPNKTTPPNFSETPSADHSLCVDTSANLPITPLGAVTSQVRANIANGLNAITVPINAGTPTDDEYAIALGALQAASPTDKYLLLITDGQPTFSLGCLGYGVSEYPVDPEPLIGHIGDAYASAQIKTLVIGSPGSEKVLIADAGSDARPWLSTAATAGGTADFQPGCSNTGPTFCHFDLTTAVDFGQALGTALQTIAQRITPCEYSITPPSGVVIDPTLINVVYTGADSKSYAVVTNQTAGNCDVGWRFTDSSATKLELCGETCSYLESDPLARIGLLLGCPVITG